ncbi:hypothetical protein DFJ73DRAFT_761039 [Zopfochytrium polystomum]|nr:hypothetical protein DFJ73DRAFT_761039 [Zopfochytrium polystomum]
MPNSAGGLDRSPFTHPRAAPFLGPVPPAPDHPPASTATTTTAPTSSGKSGGGVGGAHRAYNRRWWKSRSAAHIVPVVAATAPPPIPHHMMRPSASLPLAPPAAETPREEGGGGGGGPQAPPRTTSRTLPHILPVGVPVFGAIGAGAGLGFGGGVGGGGAGDGDDGSGGMDLDEPSVPVVAQQPPAQSVVFGTLAAFEGGGVVGGGGDGGTTPSTAWTSWPSAGGSSGGVGGGGAGGEGEILSGKLLTQLADPLMRSLSISDSSNQLQKASKKAMESPTASYIIECLNSAPIVDTLPEKTRTRVVECIPALLEDVDTQIIQEVKLCFNFLTSPRHVTQQDWARSCDWFRSSGHGADLRELTRVGFDAFFEQLGGGRATAAGGGVPRAEDGGGLITPELIAAYLKRVLKRVKGGLVLDPVKEAVCILFEGCVEGKKGEGGLGRSSS